MHYSSGNYEAFVRPRKPEGADKKTAWFVGSGLAGLAGAAFLIRDGGVSGDRITILEELEIPGGALDGLDVPEQGEFGAALGAARLGMMAATGAGPEIATAPPVARSHDPDTALAPAFAEAHQRYKAAYAAIKTL